MGCDEGPREKERRREGEREKRSGKIKKKKMSRNEGVSVKHNG